MNLLFAVKRHTRLIMAVLCCTMMSIAPLKAMVVYDKKTVDTIPAKRYITDFQFDQKSRLLRFKDTYKMNTPLNRKYVVHVYKRTGGQNPTSFFAYHPAVNSEYWAYEYGYPKVPESTEIDKTLIFMSASEGGYVYIDDSNSNLGNILSKSLQKGQTAFRIIVEPEYEVDDIYRSYYYNANVSYNERRANLYKYLINYTNISLRGVYTNTLSCPDKVKFGEYFTISSAIQGTYETTFKIQESTNGKNWNTLQNGKLSIKEAINGMKQEVDIQFDESITDSVRYYRQIAVDKSTGKADTSVVRKINFLYKYTSSGMTFYMRPGAVITKSTPADCKDYKVTSALPVKREEKDGEIHFTMPACNMTIEEGDKTYTVNFYNADHTLLKTAEVVCGGDATDLAPANPTYGNYTFTGWSKDLTNVHSNLSVVARYDIGNSYRLDASVTEHENKVFPAQGFAKSVTRAMVGDVVTFTADVFAATNATLYYEKAMWNESEQRYIWLKNSLIWVADYKQPNKECYFDQKVTVAYDANTSYIHPFEHKMAVRFILSVAGVQVYSDPVEIDIYYPLSFTTEYSVLYVENAAGDWSSNIGFIPARSNDTVWVYSSEAADGDGGCLSFGRMLYPNRSLNSGIDANGTAFVLCPGEQETVTVGVTQKLVVFDGVYGNGYPQKLDFTAEGFTKINGYYGEVVNCGGSVTIPEDPEMEGYLFKGWRAWSSDYADDAYLHVPAGSDDVIGFTADWEELPDVPYFTVRFYGKGGSPLLDTQIVLEGENATPPEAPEVSGFHFVGWDKSYVTVAEDLNITALYGDDNKSWTVTYTNWDDTPLGSEQVYDGEAAQGVPATREGYDFAEWVDATTEQPVNMQHIFADITVKASFVEAVYTITYVMRLDGKNIYEMGKENVKHGDMPVLWSVLETLAKTDMEKELGEGEYELTILGWSPEITAATQDATYEMLFTWTPRKYTVIFQDWDHTILSTQEVEYGGTAQEPAEPKRDGYIFLDWDGSTTGITSDRTLTAKYYKVDKSGFCGPKLKWVFDEETGVLTITGEGEMFDYEVVEEKIELMAPWFLFAVKEQLLQVELPEGMTTVGDVAFALCSFTSLTLPASVTRIGKMAFAECGYLEKIVLPAGLTTIGDYALGGTALKEVHNNALTPQVINSTVFMEVNISQCKLYVPAASVEAYKAAEVWKEFLIEAAPEEQPTGLDDVQSDHVQCTKVLRDGVLYIMHNGTMYNVQGQRVK